MTTMKLEDMRAARKELQALSDSVLIDAFVYRADTGEFVGPTIINAGDVGRITGRPLPAVEVMPVMARHRLGLDATTMIFVETPVMPEVR